jgi:hypothetical protein
MPRVLDRHFGGSSTTMVFRPDGPESVSESIMIASRGEKAARNKRPSRLDGSKAVAVGPTLTRRYPRRVA